MDSDADDKGMILSLYGINPSFSIPSPLSKSHLFFQINTFLFSIKSAEPEDSKEIDFILLRQLKLHDYIVSHLNPIEVPQVEKIDPLINALFNLMLSAPTQSTSSLAFTSFKLLLAQMRIDARMHTIAKMLTSCTPLSEAGIELLKSLIHTSSSIQIKSILELFEPIVFRIDGFMYRGGPGNLNIEDPSVLFEKSGVVMHALNLYLYLLIHDRRKREVLNNFMEMMWDVGCIERFRREFLTPIKRLVGELEEKLKGGELRESILKDTNEEVKLMLIQYLSKCKLEIEMMKDVTARINEYIQEHQNDDNDD